MVTEAYEGAPSWDSGVVNVSNQLPAQILCGTPLVPLHAYAWTAQWWSGELASPRSAPAAFEVGPVSEPDWANALWVGGGQNSFRLNYSLPNAVARAQLYVHHYVLHMRLSLGNFVSLCSNRRVSRSLSEGSGDDSYILQGVCVCTNRVSRFAIIHCHTPRFSSHTA